MCHSAFKETKIKLAGNSETFEFNFLVISEKRELTGSFFQGNSSPTSPCSAALVVGAIF